MKKSVVYVSPLLLSFHRVKIPWRLFMLLDGLEKARAQGHSEDTQEPNVVGPPFYHPSKDGGNTNRFKGWETPI